MYHNKYLKWLALSKELKSIKEEEVTLRRSICEELFKGQQGNFVAKHADPDCNAKATSKTSNSLDERVLQSLMGELSDDEKACIKYKPGLVASRYKLLPGDSILHEAITSKPTMPTLVVVPREELS